MNKLWTILGLFISLACFLAACGGGSSQTAGSSSAAINASGNYSPTGSSDWPLFIYPQSGDTRVDSTQPIRWTSANNARAYQLQIGTTLGGNDIFDSGIITATSVPMPPLPPGAVSYARVRAIPTGWSDALAPGHWSRGTYTSFRTDDKTTASAFINVPANNILPTGAPLEWNPSPLALGYRVSVTGASIGSSGNSGLIHTTHIFIDAVPNAKVLATLETVYLTHTVSSQLSFIAAGGSTPSFIDQFAVVKKLTADVRLMADRDNQPYGGTPLAASAGASGLSAASCEQFMLVLLQVIAESNITLNVRELDVALQENGYDTHTLVEIQDTSTARWVMTDPTFGLVTLRSDGIPATSAEISAAARNQNWSALNFELLTPAADLYARDYYIDYPLLFIDVVAPTGSGLVQDPPASLGPYFDSLPLPVAAAAPASYAIQCASGANSATADLDDLPQTLPCGGSDGLSWVFSAYKIQPSNGAAAAWRLRRFVF